MKETKNGLFLVSKQGLREGEEEEGEEEEEKGGGGGGGGGIKPRYGFLYGYITLDFGMIFVHELLGYDC